MSENASAALQDVPKHSTSNEGSHRGGKIAWAILFSVASSLILTSCVPMLPRQMSESYFDKSAGINGGFEHIKNGLPVNWLVYSPKTVPDSDFKIIIDSTDFKEGKQSLQFVVDKCSARGGWYSPGIAADYRTNTGDELKISFWVKNIGSEFSFMIRGVRENSLKASDQAHVIFLKSDDTIDNWKQFEYLYKIPEEMKNLRLDLNILKPGSFWIDDIRIVNTKTNQSPERIM